jgi:thioredoxin-like negative regulator of GroEL
MQIVNREEAVKVIDTEENVLVVFVKDACPVCKKFVPEVLNVLESRMPHVKMLEIDATSSRYLFGPDIFPSTYAFKNGVRIDWVRGGGPLEGVEQKLLNLFPIVKTQEA